MKTETQVRLTNFLKLWWIFQLGYICNHSGCLWEGEGLGVRCGEKLTFYAVSFYVFFFFFSIFSLMYVFHFRNRTSYYFKSVSPKANLERRPAATCQFPQFPQDPIPSQHAQPVVMFWNTGGGWSTFTGSVGSAVVTPSVTQMNIYGGWSFT